MFLDLDQNEVIALKQLIHFAVQARGMDVAEAAVVLVKKIEEAERKKVNGNNIIPDDLDAANGNKELHRH